LCKYNDEAELLKHAPPHMYYHVIFGCSELKAEGINTGELPKIDRGAMELRSLGMGGVSDPKIHDPQHVHVCVTTSNFLVLR